MNYRVGKSFIFNIYSNTNSYKIKGSTLEAMIMLLVDKGAEITILNYNHAFAWQTINSEMSILLKLLVAVKPGCNTD